jgi:monofunctional biosynthetic peptidoglycan transglycosylase
VSTRPLLGFDEAAGDPVWTPFDDDVMGGVSRSRFELSGAGTGLFTGRLSRAYGGGFATIRTPELELDLAGWEGVLLRVRGDGRTYGLGLRESNRRGDPGVWRHPFDTVAGEWVERELPFERFVYKRRGQAHPEAGRVDLARVRALSIVIADGDERPFRLELAPLGLYASD